MSQTFSLTLDQNDLAVIAAGLQELPMKFAKPVFDKINAQLEAAAQADAPPDMSAGGTD